MKMGNQTSMDIAEENKSDQNFENKILEDKGVIEIIDSDNDDPLLTKKEEDKSNIDKTTVTETQLVTVEDLDTGKNETISLEQLDKLLEKSNDNPQPSASTATTDDIVTEISEEIKENVSDDLNKDSPVANVEIIDLDDDEFDDDDKDDISKDNTIVQSIEIKELELTIKTPIQDCVQTEIEQNKYIEPNDESKSVTDFTEQSYLVIEASVMTNVEKSEIVSDMLLLSENTENIKDSVQDDESAMKPKEIPKVGIEFEDEALEKSKNKIADDSNSTEIQPEILIEKSSMNINQEVIPKMIPEISTENKLDNSGDDFLSKDEKITVDEKFEMNPEKFEMNPSKNKELMESKMSEIEPMEIIELDDDDDEVDRLVNITEKSVKETLIKSNSPKLEEINMDVDDELKLIDDVQCTSFETEANDKISDIKEPNKLSDIAALQNLVEEISKTSEKEHLIAQSISGENMKSENAENEKLKSLNEPEQKPPEVPIEIIDLDDDDEYEKQPAQSNSIENDKPDETEEKIKNDPKLKPETGTLSQSYADFPLQVRPDIRKSDEHQAKKPRLEIDEIEMRECVNINCKRNSKLFFKAPVFVLNRFQISNKNKSKKRYICESCFDDTVDKYGELCDALANQKPLIAQNIPYQPDLVEISDSDSDNENESQVKKELDINDLITLKPDNEIFGENDLEDIISKTLQNFRIDNQMKWTYESISKRIEKNDDELTKLSTNMKDLEKMANEMYYALYNKNQGRVIHELPPIDLNMETNEPAIPPFGKIDYPIVSLNVTYLAPRNVIGGAWVLCEVQEYYNNHNVSTFYLFFCLYFSF